MSVIKAKKSSIEVTSESITEDTCRVFLLALTGFSGSLGFILFISGCVVTSQYNLFLDFITGSYTESSVFLLLIGIVVITVSALGFYASLKSDYILMTTFLTIMVFCVISEVIGSITMFALNKDGRQQMELRNRLISSLEQYDVDTDTLTDAWDIIQTDLQCCGVTGQQDYQTSPFFIKKNQLPISCCGLLELDTMGHAEKCIKTTKSLHTTGCHEAMGEFLRGKMGVLGGVAAAVALLQITIISGASVLIKKWDVPSHCYPCY